MKRSVMLFCALLAVVFAWGEVTLTQISSLEELVSGEQYVLQNVAHGGYLQFQTSGYTEDNVINATPFVSVDEATPFTITTDGSGYILSVDGEYLVQSSNKKWNTGHSTTSSTWTISEASGNAFTIRLGTGLLNYLKYDGSHDYAYCDGTAISNNTWNIYHYESVVTPVVRSFVGDINRDHKWDVSDVTALVDIILGNDEDELYDHDAADIDGSGGIDVADVTALVDVILGKFLPVRQVEELNVMNDLVREYIEKSTSTLSSTSGNYGQSFFSQSAKYRKDQPRTKVLSFSSSSANQAQVTIALDVACNQVVHTEDVALTDGNGSYTLRNFVPGNTYYYKVMAGDEILDFGAVKASGQVRMIAIDHGFNIRDLGGWIGWNGHPVRYEQIYRGGSLGGGISYNRELSADNEGDLTEEDRQELRRLGVRALLDLRAAYRSGLYTTTGEVSYHSYSAGVRVLGDDTDYNNTQTDYGAYNQDASLISDVAWIISELKKGRPVYFNCRQGADRTGALAFLIEGLLGCYDHVTAGGGNQMALDYELTGFSEANLVDNAKVDNSYRGATEAYSSSKIFGQILRKLNGADGGKSSVQDRCYYYLNQYAATNPSAFSNTSHRSYDYSAVTWTTHTTVNNITIDKDDLDWFINHMLGTSDYEGPSWATDGGNLDEVARANANVVF